MFESLYLAQAGGQAGLIEMLLPLALIFVVFYFLLIRPQQKRLKQHREMVANLRRGDNIVTAGGLVGKITKVLSEQEVQVELAENVRVKVRSATVAEVIAKGEPADSGSSGKVIEGD